MPILKRFLITTMLTLIFGGCTGCTLGVYLMDRAGFQVMAANPSVKGRWTGLLVSVDLFDGQGNTHKATALQITSGPPMPGGAHEKLGGGALPVLVEVRENVLGIWHTDEFPSGTSIEIRGKMTSTLIPVSSIEPNEKVWVSRLNKDEISGEGEHVLIVRGTPKVIGVDSP